jgi:integrase/recombinase XerD
MTISIPAQHQQLIAHFESHLTSVGFARIRRAEHLERVDEFLGYLREVEISPEAVTPQDLTRYMRARLERHRRKHGRIPKSPSWHQRHSAGVHRFLALVQGRWPPAFTASTDRERQVNAVLMEYERSLRERRALAAATIVCRIDEARRFLEQLPRSDLAATLSALTVSRIDRYITSRAAQGLARSTCRGLCNNLRGFVRFLHETGRTSHDLSTAIITPSSYRYEGLPSTISPEQIRTILSAAEKDRSRSGLRNYAILLLLATYGLRAGEICKLRLDDIDWRGGRLWISHTKTDARTCLPLLPKVGTALLNYLRRARPRCADRQIFIRTNAPRTSFVTRSAIYSLLRRHLARVGIHLNGKRGPHVFRHARAASLLRAGVPLKAVGDLLGHRSASSTAVYLKLDDVRLRDVTLALPLPEVTP